MFYSGIYLSWSISIEFMLDWALTCRLVSTIHSSWPECNSGALFSIVIYMIMVSALWNTIEWLVCQTRSESLKKILAFAVYSAECLPTENLHGPDESILVREFLNAIAIISFHLHRLKKMCVFRLSTTVAQNEYDVSVPYREANAGTAKQPTSLQIANTMETIIEKNIFQQAGHVRGEIEFEMTENEWSFVGL